MDALLPESAPAKFPFAAETGSMLPGVQIEQIGDAIMNDGQRDEQVVWLWDSNPFNAYGAEVARVISECGATVRRFCRETDQLEWESVQRSRVLPPPQAGARDWRTAARLALQLSKFAGSALIHRPLVVLPWIEPHEEPWFALLAVARVPLVVVTHNPLAGRDRANRITTYIRRHATQVVHSERLLEMARGPRIVVAPHPAYTCWLRNTERQPHAGDGAKMGRIAFIGAARSDKGWEDVPGIARELARRGSTLLLAVGRLTGVQKAEIADVPGIDLFGDGVRYLTDRELHGVLKSCRAVVAPYSDVTASGTLIMAMTMGIPVVAYDSAGLRDTAPETMRVKAGDIAALVDASLRIETSESASGTRERLDARSRRGWRSAIAAALA